MNYFKSKECNNIQIHEHRSRYSLTFYDLFLGWPLKKPRELQTAHTTYGFQLAYQL